DRLELAVEHGHVAPRGRRIARVAHGDLHAALLEGLVGHDVVGVGRVVPDPEPRFALGPARAGKASGGSEDGSAHEQISETHRFNPLSSLVARKKPRQHTQCGEALQCAARVRARSYGAGFLARPSFVSSLTRAFANSFM